MKLNSNVKIIGQKVILVPYKIHHVLKYHEWMKSEELQNLTASQPLSLEQEYEMQKSWAKDDNKCTFIILNKQIYYDSGNEIESMIGDTNIFITNPESGIGEIEIMVAEKSQRGKGCGWEAVMLMLLYGIQHVNLKSFEAKISLTNNVSINMFQKLGFEEKSISAVFEEVTLEKNICMEWTKWLNEKVEFEMQAYDNYFFLLVLEP